MQLRHSLTGADLRGFMKAWQRGRTLATGTWHHSLASLIALALLTFLLVKFQQQLAAFGWIYHLLLLLTGLAGLILLLQAHQYWRLAKMPPARVQPPALVVRALHGADDDMVPPDGARGPIERMRAEGRDARLTLYPETSHKPGPALRADWRALLAELAGQQARSP